MPSLSLASHQSREKPYLAPQAPPKTADVERLARWMDDLLAIPGLRLRFGLDALLGLLPGVGDTATAMASMYILSAAHRHGVPRVTLARMALNVAIDALVGAIPLAGDAFDLYFKANRRNVELLKRHVDAGPTAVRKLRRSDGLFVGLLMVGIVALIAASVVGAWWILSWAAAGVSGLFA